ncbi:class I SAM-dependent methyltransferase [Chitinophaga japonensis]|uniref:Methyltransferase family protein n=1 Tax=Chitinophaga japonensis TaxID=104662 RepID=A0A562T2C8_CHIJA|nr:class I SAM-dependent methyltransferase [Chitinophaga japonensis]TWI86920.1 methyltransferase family protein [Chitinophaga japonensis]
MKQPDAVIENHYQASYFNDYQRKIGEFGGIANKFKFAPHIKPGDVVLDFGCGGGFLLKNLDCRERIGIEINPVARDYCNEVNRIPCYESLDAVKDESVDVVISNHCLEHTTNPFQYVSALYEKLKPGGTIAIVVPHDSYRTKWKPNDINNHLYSFSPMNLGNILQGAGFKQVQVFPFLHKWVPYRFRGAICKYFGHQVFHQLSWLYGRIDKRSVQIKGIGVKG